VDANDTVRYIHETRFDNGQIVDLDEKRKVLDKCVMTDFRYHDFLKEAFKTMRKNEVAWIVLEESAHRGMYHASYKHCLRRTEEEKAKIEAAIGENIYMRLNVESIGRNPVTPNFDSSIEERYLYIEKVREICKDLIGSGSEYTNAKKLYARATGLLRNISKEQKENLNEEQQKLRLLNLTQLYTNMAFCALKKATVEVCLDGKARQSMLNECVKFSKDALLYDKGNVKAHYRMFQANKELSNFDLAQESLTESIKLDPTNQSLRTEYDQLIVLKNKKEKEWQSKMVGFYNNDKLKQVEEADASETLLRDKLTRQIFL